METKACTQRSRDLPIATQYHCHKVNESVTGTLYNKCNIITLRRISARILFYHVHTNYSDGLMSTMGYI